MIIHIISSSSTACHPVGLFTQIHTLSLYIVYVDIGRYIYLISTLFRLCLMSEFAG